MVDLREYQRQVCANLFTKPGIDPLSHAALGLAGEAGEVADLVKKSQYASRTLDRERLVEELGDVLWYLTYLVGEVGLTLEELAVANVFKLEGRHSKDHYDSSRLLV